MEYKNIVLPNYDKCILNTITSILKYYNVKTNHNSSEKLDNLLNEKEYKNVIFLVLDGLGEHILNKISPNGYLSENKFDINTSNYISGPSTCIYPSLVKHNSYLNLMWVNYNKLYTAYSDNLGKTWSEHELDDNSIDEDFCKSKFISNYSDDLSYNTTSVFTINNDISIIGF